MTSEASNQIDARARDLGADLTKVGVAKEQRQQARGRQRPR